MPRSWHGLFLTVTTLLLLLVTMTMLRSGRRVAEASDQVRRTDAVIGEYLKLRALASDAESTVRGYALTRQAAWLKPLEKAGPNAEAILGRLEVLVADADQRRLVAEVRALTVQRLAALGEPAAAAAANAGENFTLLLPLLAKIDEGVAHERRQRSAREAALNAVLNRMNITGVGGVVLAGLSGLASIVLLQRHHHATLRTVELEMEKQRAIEADSQKSHFLANMSHEIRTPMNAILGFADLLASMIQDERARGYLRAIQNSGRSLLDLINDILDISRIEAGKLMLRPEPVDVRDIVEGVALAVKKQAEDKGLKLEAKTSRHVPALLEIDALRLRQILLNLASNAVKFTAKGSVQILVDTVGEASPGGRCDLLIQVNDTGVGIAEADRERVFSAFEQVSPHSRSGAQGTGLGLSITRRLVELMNGRIALDSQPGRGSAFTVTLPGIPVSHQPLDPPTEHSADFNRLRPATILVADDNATNRELIAGYLHGSHHQLLFAQDGLEVLELARTAKPDVILMDIRMPRLDGNQACRQLREDERTRVIPVIAQTASSMPDEASRLRREYAGCLQKPFHQRQLYRALEAVLGHATMRFTSPPPMTASDGPSEVLESLDFSTTATWPGLAPRLHQWAANDVARFLDSFPMLEIAGFARMLHQESARHDCPPLSRYALMLAAAAEAFEIDQVERLLREFSSLARRIAGAAPSPP